jgi:hypothetical protein
MSANRSRFFKHMASAPSVPKVMIVGTKDARMAAGVALRGSCLHPTNKVHEDEAGGGGGVSAWL